MVASVGFAPKGPNIPAQGKATRAVRVSPSPWERSRFFGISPERAKQSTCLFVSPLQGFGGNTAISQGGAAFCRWADMFRPLRGR